MSNTRPNTAERAHDEMQLQILSLWDHWEYSAGQIAREMQERGLTRNVVGSFIYRIHQADPDALARKPQSQKTGRAA